MRIGLAYLASLHDRRHWEAPSELLDHIARDRRALELGFAEGRPRDVWRRLRFVIDQARAWSEATNGNLRQYLRWVEMQSAEGARVSESILPETDDDAVRIMTIHAAKGLEFPITIVSGMSTAPMRRTALADVVFPPGGGVGYRFGKHVSTAEYEEQKPIDEQMDYHERMRLLYVACTRARDHLVVSLHRKARANAAPARANARTRSSCTTAWARCSTTIPDAVDSTVAALTVPVVVPPAPLLSLTEWAHERDTALARATRPSAIAATALTDDGAHDPAGDLEAGPAEATARSRPTAVAQGPLRHRDRTRGARHVADHRPRVTRRARRRGVGAVRSRSDPRANRPGAVARDRGARVALGA